jgi:uncharacterized membrane protein
MKKVRLLLDVLFLLFTFINCVRAQEETFADKFLGSPLVVLVAIIVINIIALIYHEIRK